MTDLEAEGLLEGAKDAGVDKIMISYHPTGRQSSSFWFHERPWLAFNSIQSGHFIRTTNFRLVGDDFAKTPVKPTLDMEPGYENITDGLVRDKPNATRISANDVRRSAYLAVFAGAAGHTYGNGEVYEFWSTNEGRAMPGWGAEPGLARVAQAPRLRPDAISALSDRVAPDADPRSRPDPDRRRGEHDLATERVEAMRGSDGSYAFVFHSHRQAVHRGSDQSCPARSCGAGGTTREPGKPEAMWRMAAGRGARVHAARRARTGRIGCWCLDDSSRGFAPPGSKSGRRWGKRPGATPGGRFPRHGAAMAGPASRDFAEPRTRLAPMNRNALLPPLLHKLVEERAGERRLPVGGASWHHHHWADEPLSLSLSLLRGARESASRVVVVSRCARPVAAGLAAVS